MEENSFLQSCSDESVVSFYMGEKMVRKGRLKHALWQAFTDYKTAGVMGELLRNYSIESFSKGWYDTGIDCEILRLGAKGWQKGKMRIRVTLEFCPDEPEVEEPPASNKPESTEPQSPLDDIRRMIKEENQ